MARVVTRGWSLVVTGKVDDHVFCRRGDRIYVRRWVKPTDRRTAKQQAQRARFREAVAAWKALPDADQARYTERARWQNRTGYNMFVSEHLSQPKQDDT